jgi:hypothetical protein
MFGEEKNLKDTVSSPSTLQGEGWGEVNSKIISLGSYTKTHKLITALYMVTDIIDKDEPLRHKLRTLGTGIISDMHLVKQNNTGYTMSFISGKVSEIISFLDIASAVNIISEMNCNILRKEFFELNEAIKASTDKDEINKRQINLSEFFTEEFPPLLNEEGAGGGNSRITTSPFGHSSSTRRREISHGHSTRIGVQKGGTLLRAIKDMSKKMPAPYEASGFRSGSDKNGPAPYQAESFGSGFDALKKERRDSIINIIKSIGTGATIKDIKDKVSAMPEQFKSLMSVSEKTLQRELVSMVKNGVLNKTGEKRWSKYFVKVVSQ